MVDIRSVDLDLLVALDALLDERSVTLAAKRLGVTQSAVSHMLGRLRDVFDDQLFVRTSRGILPTTRAQKLAQPLKRVLAEVEALFSPEEFDPAAAELTLNVAATDYAQHAILIPVICALRQKAPKLRLAVWPSLTANVGTDLASGKLDFALSVPEVAPPDLQLRVLYEERYMCAARKDHPRIGRKLSIERFCELEHVFVSPDGGGFSGATDRALAALKLRRSVMVSVSSFLVLPKLLEHTDLIALAPERLLVDYADRLKIVQPPVEVRGFTMIAVWHPRTHESPAHQWFRELLATVVRERAAPP